MASWGGDWTTSNDDFFAATGAYKSGIFNTFVSAYVERLNAVYGTAGSSGVPVNWVNFADEQIELLVSDAGGIGSGTFTISIGGSTFGPITYSPTTATLKANVMAALGGGIDYSSFPIMRLNGGSYASTNVGHPFLIAVDGSLLVDCSIRIAETQQPAAGNSSAALQTGNFSFSTNWSVIQTGIVAIANGFIPDGFTIAGSDKVGNYPVFEGNDPLLGTTYYPSVGGPITTYSPTPYDPSGPYPLFPPDGWNRKFEQVVYTLSYPGTGSGRAWFSARLGTKWWSTKTDDPIFGNTVTTPSNEYKYSGMIVEGGSGVWTVSADQTSPVDIISENLKAYQLAGGTGYDNPSSTNHSLTNFTWPGDIFDGHYLKQLQDAMQLLHTTMGSGEGGGVTTAKMVTSNNNKITVCGGTPTAVSFVDAHSNLSAADCNCIYNTYAANPHDGGGLAYVYATYQTGATGSWYQGSNQGSSFNFVLPNSYQFTIHGALNCDYSWWFLPEPFVPGGTFNDFGLGLTEGKWHLWDAGGTTDRMDSGAIESAPFPAAIPGPPPFPDGTIVTTWGWRGGCGTLVLEWQSHFNYP